MDVQTSGVTDIDLHENGSALSVASITTKTPVSDRKPDFADSIVPTDLQAALEDLKGVVEEAREDGYTEPTPMAIENARLLVETMYGIRPIRYDIYPMDDGEVAIDGGDERRIGVFCYPDGSVLYIGWADDERVRIRRDGPEDMPYEFLRLALNQLGDA